MFTSKPGSCPSCLFTLKPGSCLINSANFFTSPSWTAANMIGPKLNKHRGDFEKKKKKKKEKKEKE